MTSDTMTHYSQLIKMKNEAIDQAAARYMQLLNHSKKNASPLEIRGTTSFSQARSSLMSESKRDVKLKITKLIQKRFKNPYNAFCQMDYDGKGIIVKENFYSSLADIHNHVSFEQVESFFKREQVFQAPPNNTLDLQRFMKVFYPSVRAEEQAEDEAEDGSQTHKSGARSHSDQISKTSLEDRLKKVEELLKEKLLVNYKSARKAFLELDTNFDGLIEAKQLAV